MSEDCWKEEDASLSCLTFCIVKMQESTKRLSNSTETGKHKKTQNVTQPVPEVATTNISTSLVLTSHIPLWGVSQKKNVSMYSRSWLRSWPRKFSSNCALRWWCHHRSIVHGDAYSNDVKYNLSVVLSVETLDKMTSKAETPKERGAADGQPCFFLYFRGHVACRNHAVR